MKNIAILTGGDSSEYVISVQSAKQIETLIDKTKFKTYPIMMRFGDWKYTGNEEQTPIDKNDFSLTLDREKVKFDCVFIAIHGTPGEDGKLQAYFEMLNIPYNTCDFVTSALTFGKYYCNHFLKNLGIKSAETFFLKKEEKYSIDEVIKKTGLPCFVKPNNAGSSFGISKVKTKEELPKAIEIAFKEDNEVVIDEFVEGTEVTCGLVKIKGKITAFPLTEIVSKNEFFDYEAKYNADFVDEITPARISKELTEECQKLSTKIYDLLNCKGIVRMDYIIKNNEFYFLEVNTIPGMTKNSLVPQQIAEAGLSISEIYTDLLEEAMK